MKKILMFILVISLLTLVACGGKETSGDSGEELKELEIATDAAFAPFEFMDGGKITGFDVELAKAVLEEAGYKAKFNNVGWEQMLVAVENGNTDLAVAAISITEDRKKTNDFSIPYFQSTQMILVPEDSEITSVADLEGKQVGVQVSTTGATEAEEIFGEKSSQISMFDQAPLAIMAMQQGDVDAVIVDNVVAQEYVKNNPDAGIKGVYDNEAFGSEFYGFMYPKGSELVDEMDTALKAVIDNGTYTEIYKKWFGQEPDLSALQ